MRRVPIVLLMLVALAVPGTALAQPTGPADPPDQVVLAGDVAVPQGKVVGQVVVFDGDVTVGGVVDGDVIVLSGSATIAGQVRGDVVVVDGDILLRPTAQVGGSVRAGGIATPEAGAQVGGSVSSGVRLSLSGPAAVLGALLASVALAVSILLAGIVLVFLAPRGADRVAQAAMTAPFASAGIGCTVAIGVPVGATVTAATVVGLPFGLALLLGTALLWLVGLAWTSWIVGRLLVREPRSRAGAFAAGWAITAAVGLVPGLNVAWWTLGAVFGLGATTVAAWRARGTARHRVGAAPPPPPS